MILEVQKADKSESPLQSFGAGADAQALTAADLLGILGIPTTFNEASFDRKRGNTAATLLGQGARTAAYQSPFSTNYNARGIVLLLNITAASGTGGLTPKIEGSEPLGGIFYPIITAAAPIVATGQFLYRVYPGLTPSAGLIVNDVLPRFYRISIAVGDASSYSYSLSASLIL